MSTAATTEDFTVNKLKGHKGSVTCLQRNDVEQTLLSGAEDKTVRLWDLRTNRTVKCMTGIVADIESIRYGYDKYIVHVASSTSLYSFDLRSEGLLNREPVSQVNFSEGDEVSSIALNSKGDTLAVAMDSGVINLLSMRHGLFLENAGATRYKRLSRIHTNIVSSIQFKKNNPRELLSGGFDYTGCIWDIDKGRPKATTVFQMIQNEEVDENKMQLVNPPFVMHMNYVMDGRCVAAALGDGTIRVLNSKDLTSTNPTTTIDAHNCMVTALYTDFDHIVSGGTDSTIYGYQLRPTADGAADKPAPSGGNKKKTPTPLAPLSLEVVKLFSISHTAKINTLVCSFDAAVAAVSAASDITNTKAVVNDEEENATGKSEPATVDAAKLATDSVFRKFSNTSIGSIKVYVGDLSNDITVYTSR